MHSGKRRQFLKLAGLATVGAGVGLGAYSVKRGIRFPMLGWEPAGVNTQLEVNNLRFELDDLIHTPLTNESTQDLRFRAFAPEPKLVVHAGETTRQRIFVNNIAQDALLEIDNSQSWSNSLNEAVNGITRVIELDLKRGETATLQWQLPAFKGYKFASIGDTGGDKELAWCIQRAHALDARFLLHLGDFNYQEGDYQRSVELFSNSPIPCYVAIGNHDFHDDGHIYGTFLNQIGPLNNSFSIGRTRFANIDTAANFLPYSAGHRGQLFEQLNLTKDEFTDTVGFTHRPLHTPEEDDTHDIGSVGERDWLVDALNHSKVATLLSGHIHIYNRTDFRGVQNIIAGQGLGHQDLIVNRDYSKMLIGQVNDDGKVDYIAEPLSMPMSLHCHPRTNMVKESLIDAQHYDVIQAIDSECANT